MVRVAGVFVERFHQELYAVGSIFSRDRVVPHCSNPQITHTDCGRDVKAGGIWPWDRGPLVVH
jgi:hypothetical protein